MGRESGTQEAERARSVQRMFSAIAPTYDRLNRILSLGVDEGWRRALVSHLPEDGTRILDLACGTGDVALAAAKIRPQASVYGADFALPMLRGAEPKIRNRGLFPRISLQNASAEELPYRDASFDAVTMAFGIRNVVRREEALSEIYRVLRTGGRALILDFSLPRNRVVRACYGIYFHRILPLIGGVVSGNLEAYRYLPKSVAGFPERGNFARMMEDAGFTEVAYEDFTMGVATLYRGVRH